jgi:hypothetical protein
VGTAHIDWASFEQMIDLSSLKQYGVDPSALTITSTSAGEITISAPMTLLGQSFNATASGKLTVHDDLLHVEITKLAAASGSLDPSVASQLQQLVGKMTFETRVPDLPYHLQLDDVSANASGVNITASAKNVTLAS